MFERTIHVVNDLFIPSERNSLAPFLLSRQAFLLYILAAAILSSPFYTHKIPFASLIEPILFRTGEVVSLINEARRNAGISSLAESETLARAAQAKADDMLRRQYFSHATPDGEEPWMFLKQENYSFSAAGENLAVDFFTASEAHLALMGSPTHRANILNSRYREVGVAVTSGAFQGNQSILVVQFFGTPSKTPVTPTVEGTKIAAPRVPEIPAVGTRAAFIQRLAKGARGEDVKILQRILASDKEIYPEGIVTGYFGELTEKAVQRFQKKYSIASVGSPSTTGFGSVGVKTRAKLLEFYGDKIAEETNQRTLGDFISVPRGGAFSSPAPIVASGILLGSLLIPLLLSLLRRTPLGIGVIARTLFLIIIFGMLLISPQEFKSPALAYPAFELPLT